MQFRTELKPLSLGLEINHQSRIITLGSCFSDHIGNWLKSLKFNSFVNPFGTVYNPHSIAKYFSKSIDLVNSINNVNDTWVSLDFHSQNNQLSREELIIHLNNLHHRFNLRLAEATHIFITLGTSWVYRDVESEEIAANCHKIPQNRFKKELLPIEVIKDDLSKILSYIPFNCKVIFTVSPVRHVKDGIVENSLSKARLIEAIYQTTMDYPESCVYYPVYELFMDDLRDYRFYESDLLHPNEAGLNYVKEHFSATFFSNETIKLNSKISSLINASNHRFFNKDTKDSRDFVSNSIHQIKELQKLHPYLNFTEELKRLN